MLKFLTHKLRTQSLNEEQPYQYKAEDDHDSGTESDDEHGDPEDPESTMESETERSSTSGGGSPGAPSVTATPGVIIQGATSATASPYFLDSALPSDSDHNYDHHSSEEELEVINNLLLPKEIRCPSSRSNESAASVVAIYRSSSCAASSSSSASSCSATMAPTPSASSASSSSSATCLSISSISTSSYPEKRKWSQVAHSRKQATSSAAALSSSAASSSSSSAKSAAAAEAAAAEAAAAAAAAAAAESSSGSSDEEVQGFLAAMATPVEFRTSPPLDAHKPGRSLSPPPKLFHYGGSSGGSGATLEVSPRKRHRHTPRAHHIQRPCLDFEKMQQLKARAVTAWRHTGDHGGGELSVFCW